MNTDTFTSYSLIRDGIQSLIENGLNLHDVQAEVEQALVDHITDTEEAALADELKHTEAFDTLTCAVEQFISLGFTLPQLNAAFTEAVEVVLDGDDDSAEEDGSQAA
jgi:hypothetical protein